METDRTEMSLSNEKHPSLAELRDSASFPNVHQHLEGCSMCRSVLQADEDLSAPIPLDLPKGLVNENVFRWPVDPIARGGMAAIFAGEDRRLGRTVILKAPREGDDLPAGMADMFQRRVTAEARILAKLQHPAIVTIYELGKTTVGWPFCVLEKVEGISLRERLDMLADAEEDGVPRTRERLELLSSLVSIAEALAYAHERRVVHRDVTPNNILLGKRGEATLIDWGIARDLDAPTLSNDAATINEQAPSMSGRMVTISAGTPPYLPLEQSQGRSADPSFDVYSFGVTLYEVVSGRTPYEWRVFEDASQRAKQISNFLVWLKDPGPVPPAMPRDRELSGIIAKAMAHMPGDRFTADELVRALKQYLTGDLVFSHRYSLTGRLARWVGRHRAVTVGIVSIIAFVVAGALVWAQLSRAARQEADLRATAAAAEATAEKERREADDANREAEAAKAAADRAQKGSKEADALRKSADEKRRIADTKRRSAEDAARQAKGTAEEAVKRFQEAMKDKAEAESQRDAARTAQADAERERGAARSAQAQAEKERDTATRQRDAADAAREAARSAREAAEKERDAARASQLESEKTRDAARESQAAAEKERNVAEKERDDLRKKVAELENKLRDLERRNAPPPPPDPTP